MHEDRREKLHRAVDEAARDEEDHDKQQRNAGVAIGLLFLLVPCAAGRRGDRRHRRPQPLTGQTTPYRRSPASPSPGTM